MCHWQWRGNCGGHSLLKREPPPHPRREMWGRFGFCPPSRHYDSRPAASQALHPSFPAKAENSLATLLGLFPPQPLALGCGGTPEMTANRAAFAHRWAIPVSGRFASANRGPASNPARFFCRWQRFAGFLEIVSLYPPPAALRRFPPHPQTTRPRGPAGPLILDFIPRDWSLRPSPLSARGTPHP